MRQQQQSKKLESLQFTISEVENGFILSLASMHLMTKDTFVFNNVNSLTQFLTNYIEDNSL